MLCVLLTLFLVHFIISMAINCTRLLYVYKYMKIIYILHLLDMYVVLSLNRGCHLNPASIFGILKPTRSLTRGQNQLDAFGWTGWNIYYDFKIKIVYRCAKIYTHF